MIKKRLLLASAVLILWAALTGVGATLRALDYLIAASSSPTARGVGAFLFSKAGAAVTLLVETAVLFAAIRTPGEGTAPRSKAAADEPNIVVLSTRIMPVDSRLRVTAPNSEVWAAIVRFRNEVDQRKSVGSLLATRAMLT